MKEVNDFDRAYEEGRRAGYQQALASIKNIIDALQTSTGVDDTEQPKSGRRPQIFGDDG